jgi:hypothetical protein
MKQNIKTIILLNCLITFFAGSVSVASPGHSHGAHADIPAPNGGRMIDSVEPRMEFLLLEDRHVQLSFIDDSGTVVAPSGQTVSLVGGDRSNAVRVRFSQEGNVLRSDQALPDIAGMPIILQIKPAADSPTVREKFYLKTFTCSGCHLAEYACTCGHE